MLISLPLRQRPSSAWTGQVSLGWTKGSASGLRQEPKAPGPRFAERHSRETELSSQNALAPLKGIFYSASEGEEDSASVSAPVRSTRRAYWIQTVQSS